MHFVLPSFTYLCFFIKKNFVPGKTFSFGGLRKLWNEDHELNFKLLKFLVIEREFFLIIVMLTNSFKCFNMVSNLFRMFLFGIIQLDDCSFNTWAFQGAEKHLKQMLKKKLKEKVFPRILKRFSSYLTLFSQSFLWSISWSKKKFLHICWVVGGKWWSRKKIS